MWSDRYSYYEIRASATYSATADTKQIRNVLDALPELQRTGTVSYVNAIGFPWLELSLVTGKDGNFHVFTDTWTEQFNMIPIVCAKSDQGHVPASQLSFLVKLAQLLNWELIWEEDEDGNEDVILWRPN
ncbi:hypothetical protein [Hymenobacter jeollabukensis]|uniref:Uncharacterized protein n=1 Tax=Hymenobacter jeollabukensis TaxID=2025313 RepID=A0A5R8WQW9_9BACT|nr:hypothetical protein [Hymenobacter jeollabukensis]TLM92412.1 hypothetical protein FDY95_13355 [Hymenobacter jeollabukensis]